MKRLDTVFLHKHVNHFLSQNTKHLLLLAQYFWAVSGRTRPLNVLFSSREPSFLNFVVVSQVY